MSLSSLCGRISDRTACLVLGFGAFALVGVGVVLGEALRLNPCPLCIFQRVLYLAIGCGALIAAAGRPLRPWGLLIALMAALGGIAAAGYQGWLQWMADPALECGFGPPNLMEQTVEWLGERWPRLFLATGFCSSKEWVFLGLSMAHWSLVAFAGYVGVLAAVARRSLGRG